MSVPTPTQDIATWLQRPLFRAALGILASLLALGWFVAACSVLGYLGQPPAGSTTVLRSGVTFLPAPGVTTQGNWVNQQFADQLYLATRQPGAIVQVSFAGTELSLFVRRSPDAGKVYVLVDGYPSSSLPRDDHGSYLSLKAATAVTDNLRVLTDLAPGIHHLTLENGDGELALRAIEVRNWPALDWAVSLGLLGFGVLVFVAVIHFWRILAEQRGWLLVTRIGEGQ